MRAFIVLEDVVMTKETVYIKITSCGSTKDATDFINMLARMYVE